jgi:hypothetical protein
MPYLRRTFDPDLLTAAFDDDHTETIDLGPWTELTIGHVRLVRRDDGSIHVEAADDARLALPR